MIKEDYVSFETAKLLKEKGFDESTTKSYYTEGFENPMIFSHDLLPCIRPDEFLCPTLQMAMKWLREVHNIHIILYPYTDKKGHNWTFIFNKYTYKRWQKLGIYITDSWSSYEDAVDAAIKYCLTNLIK